MAYAMHTTLPIGVFGAITPYPENNQRTNDDLTLQ